MKLHLLSGSSPLPGYATLDADPAYDPDYLAHIPPLPSPVMRTAWDEIALIHGIEHLRLAEAMSLLPDLYAILVPGGKLILEQPNIIWCMQVILGLRPRPQEAFPEQCGLAGIFGDPSYGAGPMTHLSGYWPESLTELLVRCGFEAQKIILLPAQFHRADRDFRIEAVK